MTPVAFENHQIFKHLKGIDSLIQDEKLTKDIDLDSLIFFKTAVKYLNDRLKLTMPSLVQESELNTISTALEQALHEIDLILNSQREISVAQSYIYTALTSVRNLPVPFHTQNDFDFSKSIAIFQSTLKEKYDNIAQENNKLKSDFNELKIILESTQTEIEILEQDVNNKKTEIENLNAKFQTNFDNIKYNATQNYERDRTGFIDQFNDTIKSLTADVETLKTSIDNGTDELVKKLKSKLGEANKIVGIISNKAVTGNYRNVANDNKKTANIFRWIAIGLMFCSSGLLIYTVLGISALHWTQSLMRILSAVGLLYPANYAARESSKHRKLESFNRTAELELTAINPFIELLPEEKKQEIKEKLVDKYFGNHGHQISDLDNKGDQNISIGVIEKLIKTLIPFLKK